MLWYLRSIRWGSIAEHVYGGIAGGDKRRVAAIPVIPVRPVNFPIKEEKFAVGAPRELARKDLIHKAVFASPKGRFRKIRDSFPAIRELTSTGQRPRRPVRLTLQGGVDHGALPTDPVANLRETP